MKFDSSGYLVLLTSCSSLENRSSVLIVQWIISRFSLWRAIAFRREAFSGTIKPKWSSFDNIGDCVACVVSQHISKPTGQRRSNQQTTYPFIYHYEKSIHPQLGTFGLELPHGFRSAHWPCWTYYPSYPEDALMQHPGLWSCR